MLRACRMRERVSHLVLLIGLVILSLIPIPAPVFAQDTSASLWVVRALPTSEYGVNEPRGLAFASSVNAFLLLDAVGNVTQVTMAGDRAGTRGGHEELSGRGAVDDDRRAAAAADADRRGQAGRAAG